MKAQSAEEYFVPQSYSVTGAYKRKSYLLIIHLCIVSLFGGALATSSFRENSYFMALLGVIICLGGPLLLYYAITKGYLFEELKTQLLIDNTSIFQTDWSEPLLIENILSMKIVSRLRADYVIAIETTQLTVINCEKFKNTKKLLFLDVGRYADKRTYLFAQEIYARCRAINNHKNLSGFIYEEIPFYSQNYNKIGELDPIKPSFDRKNL